MAAYLDTSALVKLVVAERETQALIAWIEAADLDLVSSDLARTAGAATASSVRVTVPA